jgi:hypothetical protein
VSLALQPVGELARPVERQLQVQLIDPPHQHQIPMRLRSRRVVHARATEIEKLSLALHRHLRTPINHRLPLRPGNFPSAPSKRSLSTRQFTDLLVQLTDPFSSVGFNRVAAEDSYRFFEQLG